MNAADWGGNPLNSGGDIFFVRIANHWSKSNVLHCEPNKGQNVVKEPLTYQLDDYGNGTYSKTITVDIIGKIFLSFALGPVSVSVYFMNGQGAYQKWYNGIKLSSFYIGERFVNSVSFNYGSGEVINGYTDQVSAYIYSCLKSPSTDTYTFDYHTDDGSTIYFDDFQMASGLGNNQAGDYSFTANMKANQYYPFYVLFSESWGDASLTFNWKTSTMSKTTIPDSSFYVCELAGNSPYNINILSSIWGDGYKTGTEACDDGNANGGDGWSSDCTIIESNYKCTGGSSSSKDTCSLCPSGTYQSGTISPNQWTPIWGDGKVVSPEVCDDGNIGDSDGCNSGCSTIETGYMWAGGSSTSKDTCSLCTTGFYSQGTSTPSSWVSKCGDGILAGSENWDDGNTNSGDGCNSSCSLIETNYQWSGGSLSNKDTCTLWSIGYYQQGTKSPNSCVTQWGDGKLVGSEAWDDRNISNGDGWSSICTIESGYKWTGGSYSTKDTWLLWPAGTIQQGTVSPNTWVNLWGNGKLDSGEAWDDGNANSGDGCKSDCSAVEVNYACTGGSSTTKDTCSVWSFGFYSQGTQSPSSWVTHWGDGKLAGLEAWDDGNTSNGDGWSSDCTTIEAGYKWTGGTYSSKDVCTLWPTGTIQQGTTSPNSWLSLWGDGKLQTSESCDDGNINNGDGWSNSWMIENGYKCTGGTKTSKDTWALCDPGTYQQGTTSPNSWVPLCGDGKLAGGEACDDGNTANGDGWNSIWTSIESNYKCAGGSPISRDTWMLCPVGTIQQGTTSPNVWGTSWGNGKLEGGEAWDDGNTNSGDGWNSNCSSIERFSDINELEELLIVKISAPYDQLDITQKE